MQSTAPATFRHRPANPDWTPVYAGVFITLLTAYMVLVMTRLAGASAWWWLLPSFLLDETVKAAIRQWLERRAEEHETIAIGDNVIVLTNAQPRSFEVPWSEISLRRSKNDWYLVWGHGVRSWFSRWKLSDFEGCEQLVHEVQSRLADRETAT